MSFGAGLSRAQTERCMNKHIGHNYEMLLLLLLLLSSQIVLELLRDMYYSLFGAHIFRDLEPGDSRMGQFHAISINNGKICV